MLRKRFFLSVLLLFILAACAGATAEPAPLPADDAAVDADAPPAGEPPPALAEAPAGVAPPPGYEGQDWVAIVEEARGQTVNFYMWGGSDLINRWVTGWVAPRLEEKYGITLNMVPVTDATEYINKVLGEKEAGQDSGGSVDLVWVNGENFRTMRQGDLLYGGWSRFLPNSAYVNWDDPSVANDFGYPVEGYEAPYGKAQFVMIYDSARVPEPPASVPELIAWIEAHPGQFTYPAPPDFTGSAFMRHICYHTAGGYEPLLGDFDQALFAQASLDCWTLLNRLEPSLWREGQTYPESHTRQQELFADGEVSFDMAYNPAEASSLIENGRYPQSTRTFVFEEGTLANTHYVAIPYNSDSKAAAMVVSNFLLSPEAQLSKAQPANWGDLPVLDPALLPGEWQERFEAVPRGPATLAPEVLAAHRLPELQAAWLTAFEQGWEAEVLQK